ncbi:TPA: hypothetical protein U0601_001373 [Streptococcus suis]|nr:hypothetical protein [Streptococcus suis]HEL1906537.1 hypothetical protein [Streptococcus suis]HEL2725498.1 hypothetical protein [Streptococcus suis]HEM2547316.1 hypothetical protein [Streptococcus suis]HEM2752392.1 hypothetical protein [Streptococcus suis]
MNQLDFNKNQLQMDYFSDSYRKFEADFYRYSALDTPLTFLTDDIMLAMAKSQKSYFKLNKENAKDYQDHYFMFNVEPLRDNRLVRLYQYLGVKTRPTNL